MFGFGNVFNRKPRQFKYTPRYYDPEKEARDRRRIELGLEPLDKEDLKPGDRLRMRRMAHSEQFNEDSRARRRRGTIRIFIILALLAGAFWLIMSINF